MFVAISYLVIYPNIIAIDFYYQSLLSVFTQISLQDFIHSANQFKHLNCFFIIGLISSLSFNSDLFL